MGSEIVLVGGGGMLGRAFRVLLPRAMAPTRGELDLTAPATVDKLGQGPTAGTSIVINCAAHTDVDGAESDEPAAMAVNAEGAGCLARRCAEIGATLVHFSTDYVFSGDASEPYPVDAPIRPAGAYAKSKAAGEQAIRDSGCDALVIRTSWLYAPWGKNFVLTIAKLAAERDSLRVVDDQRGRPTSAEQLALNTLTLLDSGARGTLHVTDGGECTWYELAREIVRLTGARCELSPCTTEEFPRPAPRPAYSVMDLSRTEALIGPVPHWKVNVRRVLASARLLTMEGAKT
jgi:dTDP-4-dehydrorhamnose reductase